jgi:hypothetical protein
MTSASQKFTAELDKFLAALVRVFVQKFSAAEVAVLTYGRPTYIERVNEDEFYLYTIMLEVPVSLFNQVADCDNTIAKNLHHESQQLMGHYPGVIVYFGITPQMPDDPDWRHKAQQWLSGETVSNQGRVRSDAVAPYEADGLRFRSRPEIHLYHALKRHKISFAPLPVFIRGGELGRRVEPDFVIFYQGRVIVLEVDGPQFHHETPTKAHERLTLLQYEGAHIERIEAIQCNTPEKAETCANSIIALLKKLAANK